MWIMYGVESSSKSQIVCKEGIKKGKYRIIKEEGKKHKGKI